MLAGRFPKHRRTCLKAPNETSSSRHAADLNFAHQPNWSLQGTLPPAHASATPSAPMNFGVRGYLKECVYMGFLLLENKVFKLKNLKYMLLFFVVLNFIGCATTITGAKDKSNYERKLNSYKGKVYVHQKDGKEVSGFILSIDDKQMVLSNNTQIDYSNIESMKTDKKISDIVFLPLLGVIVGVPTLAVAIVVFPPVIIACILGVKSIQNVCGGS